MDNGPQGLKTKFTQVLYQLERGNIIAIENDCNYVWQAISTRIAYQDIGELW